MMLRVKATEKILKALDQDKATGPDGLPGRILKECAEELALPVTILAKRMLVLGSWPECWRYHWISPLFTKGLRSNASNYRGVHLASVLSKTVERVLGKIICDYLEESGSFGETQWAFRAGHACRDLVALATSRKIL